MYNYYLTTVSNYLVISPIVVTDLITTQNIKENYSKKVDKLEWYNLKI